MNFNNPFILVTLDESLSLSYMLIIAARINYAYYLYACV
jgi:hypothetical protein